MSSVKIEKPCLFCGKLLLTSPRFIVAGRGKYCNSVCFHATITKTPLEILWEHVSKTDGCWEWIGRRNKKGYGLATNSGRLLCSGNVVKAHRLSWFIHNGPIPEGMLVLHRCDNPPCVRPDHLFLGTHQDNLLDSMSKGRRMPNKGELNGRSKLCTDDIPAIRELINSGISRREISRKYGVNESTIRRIARNRGWTHVSKSPDRFDLGCLEHLRGI